MLNNTCAAGSHRIFEDIVQETGQGAGNYSAGFSAERDGIVSFGSLR